MKWLIAGLLALGLAFVGLGYAAMNANGSADERAGGALPMLIGLAIIATDFVVAFVWLLIRA